MMLSKRAATVLVTGALAVSGGVGVVGIQAFAPDDSGMLQRAHALTKKAGWYGRISKMTTGQPGITSIKVSGSKMTVRTSNGLRYGKSSRSEQKVLSKKKFTFKLSSKVKYYDSSSKGGSYKLSAADGKSKLKAAAGYYVEWKVGGGKVTRVNFWGK